MGIGAKRLGGRTGFGAKRPGTLSSGAFAQSQKLGKSNMLNVIRSKKAKGPKQDRQKQLRSPMAMSEGEEFEDTKGQTTIYKTYT